MKSKPRTQADRSAATKDALIRAARPLFTEHGFGGVGAETIVRSAGVTRGAMYHQFADKTELFAAVFETIEVEITARIDEAVGGSGETDPIAMMRVGASVWLDAMAEPAAHRIVLVEGPVVLGWERWREIGLSHGLGLVQELLEIAMQVGRVPKQPVAPLAHVVMGALDEAALYISQAGSRKRARKETGVVIDRLITSLTVA